MSETFKRVELGHGIVVEFSDQSNRYYGDFHRVKVVAVSTIPFVQEALPDELQQFALSYQGRVTFEKNMEQMGVTSTNVDSVKNGMVDNFIASVGSYLKNDNFAESLIRKQKNDKSVRGGSRY